MNKLTQFLTEPFLIEEGVNDPGILKAVFLAGGPGSGKGYVSKGLFGIPKSVNVSAHGLKNLTLVIRIGKGQEWVAQKSIFSSVTKQGLYTMCQVPIKVVNNFAE